MRRPVKQKYGLPRIDEMRIQAKLSIQDLASASGVSRDMIRSLNKGNHHKPEKVQAVFDALAERIPGLIADNEILKVDGSGD